MRWLVAATIACSLPARADSSCPVRKVAAKAPTLITVADVAAARKRLLTGSTAMEQEVDIVEPAKTQSAFKVDVRRAYEHGGDSSLWDSSAVFVLAKRVVIASRMVKWALVIPERCGPPRQDEIVDVKLATLGKRQLGIVRVRRVAPRDTVTLAAVAPRRQDPNCSETATYRIEDHVLDLDKRRELLVLAAAYTGPVFEDHVAPLAALQLTNAEASVPDTSCTFTLRP